MAHKEHGMWGILDVLKRLHSGEGIRAVARNTGRSRNTVKRYKQIAEDVGWVSGTHKPDEELAEDVIALLGSGGLVFGLFLVVFVENRMSGGVVGGR